MTDTARTIINEALQEIRVLDPEEIASDDVATRTLAKLNDMLDSWSMENILCYAQQEENFALTIGDGDYTIGTGGNFNTTRPKSINQAWVRDSSGYDRALAIWGTQRYGEIRAKAQSGFPSVLYYYPNYPLAQIKIAELPAEALTLYIVSDKPLASFAALSTTYSFPPGYKRALVANLAVDRAPSWGKKPSDELKEIALSSKETIRRLNLPEVVASYDPELRMYAGAAFDINTGGYR